MKIGYHDDWLYSLMKKYSTRKFTGLKLESFLSCETEVGDKKCSHCYVGHCLTFRSL